MNQVQPARKLRKSCKLVSDIFFFWFQIYFISSNMLYFNGYIVLLLGINYELILKQFSIKSAGMITVLSIPLG